jgi:hypothetical protein
MDRVSKRICSENVSQSSAQATKTALKRTQNQNSVPQTLAFRAQLRLV